MNTSRRSILSSALIIGTIALATTQAVRAAEPARGWAAIARRGADTTPLLSARPDNGGPPNAQDAAPLGPRALVGTWLCEVDAGLPSEFYALQTYNADGTMTETSDLLGMGAEGPAHGVWRAVAGAPAGTFELFSFEGPASTGRIRVRTRFRFENSDRFIATYRVDILPLDGPEIAAVASGEFVGERVPLLPIER